MNAPRLDPRHELVPAESAQTGHLVRVVLRVVLHGPEERRFGGAHAQGLHATPGIRGQQGRARGKAHHLVGVGAQVGWTAREISRSIKATRKDLYGEAKDVIARAEHMPPPPNPGQHPTGPGQPPPLPPA